MENIFKISLPDTTFFRPNNQKNFGGRTLPDKLGEIRRSPDQGSEQERGQGVREIGKICGILVSSILLFNVFGCGMYVNGGEPARTGHLTGCLVGMFE